MKKCISPLFRLTGLTLFALVLILPLTFVDTHAQVKPGQLIVLDLLGGGKLAGAIYLVDPESGARLILSNFSDTAQGTRLSSAQNVVVAPSGHIYITSATLLFRVNPLTGNRQPVSNLENNEQGTPLNDTMEGLAVRRDGKIYAMAQSSKLLLLIDPATGNRIIIADLGDLSMGPFVQRPDRIILEDSETTMLILDRGRDKIVRLDLSTGRWRLVSAFDNPSQGNTGRNLADFALEASGSILVTTSSDLKLIRVGTNGGRSLVSDFNNREQGPVGRILEGVIVNGAGQIFVVDASAGGNIVPPNGSLFEVDSETGQRTIRSNFGDATEGPKGFRPTAVTLAVAVSPTPEEVRLVRTVLLATESVQINKSAAVISGNVITNEDFLEAKVNIKKDATTPSGFEVMGRVILIGKGAVAGGDVLWDQRIVNKGTILGTETRTSDFPAFDALLPFRRANTGDAKILVPKNGVLSLPPGRFQSIKVGKDATLVLEGGIYEAEKLTVGKSAKVIYAAPVDIRVSNGVKFGKESALRPPNGSFLDAKSAVFYTEGNFKVGTGSAIRANIIGPNSIIQVGNSAALTGFIYGRKVVLGKSARAVLRNFLEDSLLDLE